MEPHTTHWSTISSIKAGQAPASAAGQTTAHLAERWGHVKVLKCLHAHGADLHAQNRGVQAGDCHACLKDVAESMSESTPLAEAVKWRRPACVAFLQGLLVYPWSCLEQ